MDEVPEMVENFVPQMSCRMEEGRVLPSTDQMNHAYQHAPEHQKVDRVILTVHQPRWADE